MTSEDPRAFIAGDYFFQGAIWRSSESFGIATTPHIRPARESRASFENRSQASIRDPDLDRSMAVFAICHFGDEQFRLIDGF